MTAKKPKSYLKKAAEKGMDVLPELLMEELASSPPSTASHSSGDGIDIIVDIAGIFFGSPASMIKLASKILK